MVYIIGTGPGDEDLLTIRAIKAMKKCTAVLYDRLIGGNVLNYLDENCEIYYCGKEPGCHYKTQEEINKSIIELWGKGHIVGRIKGGDPYVFGRGSEEALELLQRHIPFEVVPGITSPIGVLNYAGIPVTHRGTAQSFHIITGTTSEDSNINWGALGKLNGTLIFVMGLKHLKNIVENLRNNGMDENTPCGVIMRGTTSKQRKAIGTLKNISEIVEKKQFQSPCIIAIGPVVEMSEKLNWYEKLPLYGINVCITRSKKQSIGIKNKLKDLGAEVTEINSIAFKDTSYNLYPYLKYISDYEYLIFTSANSVNFFFDYLTRNSIDVRMIKSKIFVIGDGTKGALNKRGIIENFKTPLFNEDSLIELFRDGVKSGERVLLPCSNLAKSNIKKCLEKLGLIVDRPEIYETLCGLGTNKNAFKDVDVVVFTSPSTVNNMIHMVGIEKIKEKKAIAIGPITYNALEKQGIKAISCSEQSEEAIIETVRKIAEGKHD